MRRIPNRYMVAAVRLIKEKNIKGIARLLMFKDKKQGSEAVQTTVINVDGVVDIKRGLRRIE